MAVNSGIHERQRIYIAIDLKSFYASVECADRKLDPLVTNLVVADPARTDKTICLAVSPGLKSYGLPGRPRLFEVVQAAKGINADRRRDAPGHAFTGKSFLTTELEKDPSLELDYIVAPPRMALYMKYSTDIYKIYLKYISADDILVYSCDEVFMDVTEYLNLYDMTAHELAITMIRDVLVQTGITATAGIGTNLFLSKVAMDIVAKKLPADKDGVRIAELDERSFRSTLCAHTPVTDFWGFGSGTAKRLAKLGIFTLGDLAGYSEICEDNLYKAFGVKAELIIDHAWGWEPCTMQDIKKYRPKTNSLSSGQVLMRPYSFDEAAVIVREMTDLLTLDLVKKKLVTDQMTLTVCYECFRDPDSIAAYRGEMHYDWYGRPTPKHAHGTANLKEATSSARVITDAMMRLYDRITDRELMVRRIYVCACRTVHEDAVSRDGEEYEQLDLFTDYEARERERKAEREALEKEKALQTATADIRQKFGKNAILKGTNFLEGATTRERNEQIGGHRA
ncbi:MAG: DNA methylase [Lachnospiraceae bacterium]|nr:DNA methylase [Lachnospiraceae bacterium]